MKLFSWFAVGYLTASVALSDDNKFSFNPSPNANNIIGGVTSVLVGKLFGWA